MNIDTLPEALIDIVRKASGTLSFTIVEIGALPIESASEPFHQLLDQFPGSRVIAFEPDDDLCRELNRQARPGLSYFPTALGKTNQECNFYETRHSMCSSLYKPNEQLTELYNGMDVARIKSVSKIKTVTLDSFITENTSGDIDFIKIDVQGAELDIFQGAASALKTAIAIVSEVEFIPLYENQPLFGDVSDFLSEHGFMFHNFLGLCGRSLKPVILNNDVRSATQHMWSDALFVKNPLDIKHLSPDQLLKLSIISYLYGSPDLALFSFNEYDRKKGTSTAREFIKLGG